MLLFALLVVAVCVPAPLPPPETRTDDVWKTYLTDTLHACYGWVDPVIDATPAAPFKDIAVGYTFCLDIENIACTILMEPAFLQWAPSPEYLVVVMGHEASHIATHVRPAPEVAVSELEEDIAADLFAATSRPMGACLLVQIYEWHLGRHGTNPSVLTLQARLVPLRQLCAVQKTRK